MQILGVADKMCVFNNVTSLSQLYSMQKVLAKYSDFETDSYGLIGGL